MNKKPSDIERIAHFMNGFIGFEMFEDVPCPENLQCDYDDLDNNGKKNWFEYTYNAVLKDAIMGATELLRRELRKVETSLIERRILKYFQENDITPSKD